MRRVIYNITLRKLIHIFMLIYLGTEERSWRQFFLEVRRVVEVTSAISSGIYIGSILQKKQNVDKHFILTLFVDQTDIVANLVHFRVNLHVK